MLSLKKVIEYVELIGDRTNVELAYRSAIMSNQNAANLNIHSTLRKQLENLLTEVGVIQNDKSHKTVDEERAKLFFSHVDAVQLAKEHTWQPRQIRPKLFTSPPELIPQSMAADVDDIRNLITELVRGVKESLTIMSPYTTAGALRDILKPLSLNDEASGISVKVYIANPLEDARRQINALKKMIPERIFRCIIFFYRADVSPEDDSILHAKILIADGVKGYLGSANFTSQGLEKHFELGIEMSPKQAKLSEELLEHLVSKRVFLKI
jgi:phosphatidylserine/phosphatidylglycerophosphate/cardiolipin synthase-like enzyme